MTTLAAVLGTNCRRIRTRAGVTQDELAKAARQVGLKWTPSKVRDFESGRSAPTFATVLALTVALDNVTEVKISAAATSTGVEMAISLNPAYQPVRLADLVSGAEGWWWAAPASGVTVTEDFRPSAELLVDFCSGGTWPVVARHDFPGAARLGCESDSGGLTEHRVAATLGIDTEQLGARSLQLWNTTFSSERDRRAGPDANAQRKGRITRQLKAELEKVLTDGDN